METFLETWWVYLCIFQTTPGIIVFWINVTCFKKTYREKYLTMVNMDDTVHVNYPGKGRQKSRTMLTAETSNLTFISSQRLKVERSWAKKRVDMGDFRKRCNRPCRKDKYQVIRKDRSFKEPFSTWRVH